MYGGRTYSNSHHHHHHYPNHHHKGAPPSSGVALSPESALATDIFEQFIAASTFKSVLHHYRHMCDVLRLRPQNIRHFYPKLKNKIRSWKAQALWSKFDKRASHKCYNHGKACTNTKILIIGAGPCGLRSAIEAQLLGAKVVVVEKRDRFSRNNVLHLWPFVIADLKALGAKKFYGKFCAGAIDHISIRQLQCMLLKVALLLGVEVYEGVTFEELLEPPEDQSQLIGWHARFSPLEHPVNQYEFDVLIGADGKRNTLMGFKRKEFRGKLAIAITANFINKHTEQEARVQEISGVAFIFNQKFFKDLYAETGIDLENIVYYKDETHYFVMTAKKHSLIDKGVILRDLPDTQQLLHPNNVDRNALCEYAREAADFSTGYQMPHLDFAVNHYGKPDIAMFDFTSMFAAENACRVVERNGHKLLQCLVGDSLLEPFWPTGSGCARGFLSSFDACWALRSWSSGKMSPLEVVAERESIYRLLAQTTPENLSKDYSSYTLEPSSRYPTVNLKVLLAFQVRHLYITDEPEKVDVAPDDETLLESAEAEEDFPRKRKRRDSLIQPDTLLAWCQKQVAHNEDLNVEDLGSSFKDGRVLCTILHRYRPDLVDIDNLDPSNHTHNAQLAFDIFERDFGIPPVMTGAELANGESKDPPFLIGYIAQIHDALRGEIPHSMGSKPPLKVLKGQSLEDLDLEDFPDRPKDKEMEKIFFESNLSSSTSVSSVQTNGRLSCRILEEPKPESVLKEDLQKTKKRRNEFGSLDANAYERRLNLERNREDRLKKLKEQRELDTVRFVRSMRMLHCDVRDACTSLQPKVPSFRQQDDPSLVLYRKGTKSMREKAHELEKKLYSSDKMDEDPVGPKQRGLSDQSEDFSDRVKGLEAKFRGGSGSFSHHKPKDLIRAVGRLEKTDWNLSAIERKIEENPKPMTSTTDKERVPKWNRDNYKDKFQNIERRLRENGEDEERIAKYLDIDASLKRLERKLREGSTLETGLRGHNKVSDLAHQLSSKLVRKEDDTTLKTNAGSKQARAMVLPTSGSDLCYFCNTRVYLVERLSAEGKFFHRHCFKCSYCGALLRLGNYIYDRENRYGGKFFCIPHFGLTVRSRGSKKVEEMEQQKAAEMKALTGNIFSKGDADGGVSPLTRHDTDDRRDSTLIGGEPKRTPPHLTPPGKGALSLDRGTTPERVEFENSVIEYSDEEKYLSEDEWTDRNFGASANELDDDDDEDSDSYSDLSDEEVDEEALLVETSQNKLTADETRRLAESWKRRYSNDLLHMSDEDADESFSESENDDDLSEHGAEGDESHTPTEDEVGDDHDDDDDDGDDVRRARELRRLELNINVGAPPRKAETSDSGSETEVGSEEESDTQIDTDSEFADDRETSRIPKEIPTIVIDEMPKEGKEEVPDLLLEPQEKERSSKEVVLPLGSVVPEQYVSQAVDMSSENEKDRAERSVSMSNIPRQGNTSPSNPRTEQLKRLLQRTESTEVVSAQRNYLRRQYLLGNNSYSPRKSVSTADLGNRFKSFMDKISETQKKLNPAPQPSPAMQAFLNMSNKNVSITSPTVSPSRHSPSNYLNDSKELTPTTLPITDDNLLCEKDSVFTKSRSGESSDSSSKSEEGKLITFPSRLDGDLSPKKESSSSSSVSAYDNVASTKKESIAVPCLEEKGALDSEQSERSNLEKHLENAIGTELCPDNDTVALIEAFNTPCLDESQNPVEALNMEIISTENMKNAAIVGESQLEELDDFSKNSSRPVDDDNVEEVFDQLANDALIEFNRSNSATSLHILEEAFLVKEEHEGEKEAKDNITPAVHILDSNFNLKNDNSQQQNVASEKKQDESGFKSMEETKSSSSSGKNLVKPLVETTQNDVSEGAALTNANQSDVISPDAEAVTTEADLSDWADDNETFGINADDFEAEFSLCKGANTTPPSASRVLSSTRPSESSGAMKPIARIASLESLGDSDSAISISNGKAQPVAHTKPSPFAELETMEFMDSSGSDSSQEDIPSVCISYNQLQDCTPTSPSPPPNEELVSNPVLPRPSEPLQDSKRDITAVKSKSVDKEDTLNQVVPPRSSSEPPSLKEPTPAICHDSSSETEDSPDDYSSHSKLSSPQGVYEGYIPRFKDRKVPFNLARDSIDVRKSSSSKPLFTPSRDDVLQREKNESDRSAVKNDPLSFSLLSSPTTDSPQETPSPVSSVAHSYGRNAKAKDGDLVREMVMSRISKNGEARTPRRGSRNALHLSLHSSSSSLFSSEPSLLLDTSAATNKSSSPTFSPEEKKSVSTATNPTVTSQEHDSRGDVIAQAPPPPTSVKLASTENVVPFKEQRSEDIPSPSDLGSSKLSLSFHKMAMNSSPIPKQCDYSTRNVLPATPLTHPERFQREDAVKRELFKSSPQLHFPPPTSQQTQTTSYPPLATGSSQVTYSSSIHAAAPNLNKSLELPLLVDQNVNLSKSLVNNYSTKESPVPERVRRLSETETKRESGERERPQSLRRSEVGEKPSRKDPDERLKELLEERRRKDASEQREVRLRKKDSCLQECLEEYRQKRSSAPVFTQTSTAVSCPSVALELKMKGDSSPHTRAQLGLAPHRQFHRPSILELESMQIFSSPTRSVRESTTPPSATTGVTSTPVGSVTSANPAPSSIAPPFSILTPSPPSSKDSSFSKPPSSPGKDQPDGLEKKSVKRSKDRERRRSLIQVVAGMFSKSDEKKKEDGETEAKSSTSEKSSLPLVTPTGSIPPKSPSVKERFSKLRLSRTKEKKKSSSDGKNRSASVDNPAATGTSKGKDSSHPMSLPTTPSRTIFSFLSSSPVKPFESKSKSSASEENNSDDESTQMEVAPPIKDSPPSMSTPSLRRQKAALRVAKQAEQKRLRMAQEIQRQLEECDVKMRDLEERGIGVEKALIGETEGTARDETELMKDWFCLVHEKNALVRWQEELTVKARELELEDRHVRLENELRQRMTSAEREKTREDIEREGKILAEIISIIEQKDALVNLLEEDRQRYVEEDRDLELLHARKILQRPAFERETGV